MSKALPAHRLRNKGMTRNLRFGLLARTAYTSRAPDTTKFPSRKMTLHLSFEYLFGMHLGLVQPGFTIEAHLLVFVSTLIPKILLADGLNRAG